jgi:hypothetical protein
VFAGTYSGTELALYVDGRKVASQTYAISEEMNGFGNNRFCIGNDTGSSNVRSRKAAFDEFKAWDIALTEEQIAQDYGEIIGGDEGACMAAWAIGNGLPSDLNTDCSVDAKDLAIFAGEWLSCTPAADVSCP